MMHEGIRTMLHHRNRTSLVKHTDITSLSDIIIYTMFDDTIVIRIEGSFKKHHGISILPFKTESQMLVIADKISRPAYSMLQDSQGVECLEMNLCLFDRMKSTLVPRYIKCTEHAIVTMEDKYKCLRQNWPVLCMSDPIARYLGFTEGTVVVYGVQQTMRIVTRTD
jgi:DNA-directed RNA polymerase subunit H (RpoH/RPB5)